MAKMMIEIDDAVLIGALTGSKEQQLSFDAYVEQALRQAQNGAPVEQPAAVDINAVLEEACAKAQALSKAERFHLPDLIGADCWKNIGNGDRKTLGKIFRGRMEKLKPKIAKHVGRTSANLAIYERV